MSRSNGTIHIGEADRLLAALEEIGEGLADRGRPGPDWYTALEWSQHIGASDTTIRLKLAKLVKAGMMEQSGPHKIPESRAPVMLFRLK